MPAWPEAVLYADESGSAWNVMPVKSPVPATEVAPSKLTAAYALGVAVPYDSYASTCSTTTVPAQTGRAARTAAAITAAVGS